MASAVVRWRGQDDPPAAAVPAGRGHRPCPAAPIPAGSSRSCRPRASHCASTPATGPPRQSSARRWSRPGPSPPGSARPAAGTRASRPILAERWPACSPATPRREDPLVRPQAGPAAPGPERLPHRRDPLIAGLLEDDRVLPLAAWADAKLATLAPGIAACVCSWLDALLHGTPGPCPARPAPPASTSAACSRSWSRRSDATVTFARSPPATPPGDRRAPRPPASQGPGRAPVLDTALQEPALRPGGGRDFRRLTGLLRLPHDAAGSYRFRETRRGTAPCEPPRRTGCCRMRSGRRSPAT